MASVRSLPARPSLDSLRKQARKLVRDVAAGDAGAVARALAQLPGSATRLTQRQAQLVIAREYGFPGWTDLIAEVGERLGSAVPEPVAQARRAIHDNDLARLRQLIADHPDVLSWRGGDSESSVLGFATGSYGDAFEAFREPFFTRLDCAELLIDAGAVVLPGVREGILRSRARQLLQLFSRKGLLPRTLEFLTAIGDETAVRSVLDRDTPDLAAVTEAFRVACDFQHEAIASRLLDRAAVLDPALAARVDDGPGRARFITYFIEHRPADTADVGPWRAMVMEQVRRSISSWSGGETSVASPAGESNLAAFRQLLETNPWLLDESFIDFQAEVIERATLKDRPEFITALLALNPALLRRSPPPRSQAIEFAFTYAKTHLVPLLTRVWPLPDDLPHAAGLGDLERVARWFDEAGVPTLGDLARHYPSSPYMPLDRVREYARQWGPPSAQRVLDIAFAWAVINRHLDVADVLLARGADINTAWSSHEPASLLHELVFHANYESMQFLIDRGIDMTIKDYRWNSTAQGWARHAAKDEQMATWLAEAEGTQNARA